jgi:hypothetical protein
MGTQSGLEAGLEGLLLDAHQGPIGLGLPKGRSGAGAGRREEGSGSSPSEWSSAEEGSQHVGKKGLRKRDEATGGGGGGKVVTAKSKAAVPRARK